MIVAVLFDLDGVIIDSEPIHFNLERQMFAELNIPVAVEEHYSYVGMSSENMWQTIVIKHNLSRNVKELVKKKHELYLKHLIAGENLHRVPGAAELIRELYKNNFKLVIASSSPAIVIEEVVRKFNLGRYFIGSVSGTELTHSKPHPEIFLRGAKLAGCEPQNCVVIEDSENGVKAAKAAGMKCIGFLNPNSGAQNLDKADVIINSFKELNIDFFRKLD